MEKKTRRRIEKREERLPKHTLDTCIFMSYLVGDKDETICRKYMSRINAIYIGYVSLPVYGELLNEIFRESNGKSTIYHKLLGNLFNIISYQNFKYYVPSDKAYDIYKSIRSSNSRIDNIDAFILATAIEKGVDTLVTLDNDLLNNREIEKKFSIRIKHPSQL